MQKLFFKNHFTSKQTKHKLYCTAPKCWVSFTFNTVRVLLYCRTLALQLVENRGRATPRGQGFPKKKKKNFLKKNIYLILSLNFVIFIVLAPPNFFFFNLAPQILNPSSAPSGKGIYHAHVEDLGLSFYLFTLFFMRYRMKEGKGKD